MSFVATGIKLPLAMRRAIVAFVFGVIGFVVAIFGLHDAGARYTNFLLIIAYWIAPWLAVVFCDQFLRRREDLLQTEKLLFNQRYTNWAGPVAMIIGVAVSVSLFSNQTEFIAVIPRHFPSVGDITFEVGFVLTAIVYLTWHAIAGTYRRPVPELMSGR
jgi:purine-cytosine permease-like protein